MCKACEHEWVIGACVWQARTWQGGSSYDLKSPTLMGRRSGRGREGGRMVNEWQKETEKGWGREQLRALTTAGKHEHTWSAFNPSYTTIELYTRWHLLRWRCLRHAHPVCQPLLAYEYPRNKLGLSAMLEHQAHAKNNITVSTKSPHRSTATNGRELQWGCHSPEDRCMMGDGEGQAVMD